MKRRDFLKTPAVSLLIPAAGGLPFGSIIPADGPGTGASQVSGTASFTQRLHQDASTYAPGVEYFFLGNGEIHAALQYQPDRSGELPMSFLGLTLMDAEHFSRKWSTFLFHPERGYENSQLIVHLGNVRHIATPDNFIDVRWKLVDSVPVVSLQWNAGTVAIEEEFFVPATGCHLVRRVRVRNSASQPAMVTLRLQLVPNYVLFDEIGTDAKTQMAHGRGFTEISLSCLDGEVKAVGRYDITTVHPAVQPASEFVARFVYGIRAGTPRLTAGNMPAVWRDTAAYWKPKALVATNNEQLNHLYAISRAGLKSQLANSGKRDSGYWQYNMEWVRDDVMMVQALSMAGMHDEARTVLLKNLTKNVSPDGCLVESSRWSGHDYTELDQNGQLVFAAWHYLCWTGDREFVKKFWPVIVRAGDYPLMDVFRNKQTGLLRNKREFWERDDRFGIEDGYELAYQFWVMLGLERGSQVARMLGDAGTSTRWSRAAAELKKAIFEDSQSRLIEGDRLIKRRTLDGRWQRFAVPANRSMMPPGSPAAVNEKPELEPDSANLYPIIFGYVDPKSPVARNTLEGMDILWNQQWSIGGYSRYNTTSEPDPPAPWPIASLLVARAAIEMGDAQRAWRAINWVASIHGGKSGGWFERYGPSITPPAPPVSVVGWAWAEMITLIIHHLIGFRPNLDDIVIRPHLIEGLDRLQTAFLVRGSRIGVTIKRSASPSATIDGVRHDMHEGGVTLAYPRKGKQMEVELEVTGR
jgi:hypothetical protein